MEKAQAKGDVAEEELRALEMDVTGKVRSNKRIYNCRRNKTLIVRFGLFIGHACFMAGCSFGGRPGPPRSHRERFEGTWTI